MNEFWYKVSIAELDGYICEQSRSYNFLPPQTHSSGQFPIFYMLNRLHRQYIQLSNFTDDPPLLGRLIIWFHQIQRATLNQPAAFQIPPVQSMSYSSPKMPQLREKESRTHELNRPALKHSRDLQLGVVLVAPSLRVPPLPALACNLCIHGPVEVHPSTNR